MNAEIRTTARSPRSATVEPATDCTKCPVCGSEECLLLEELGTYCATMTAASLAAKEEALPGKG